MWLKNQTSQVPVDRNVARRSLAVVIPAGPGDDAEDTLRSVLHYAGAPRTVIVIDDTGGRCAGLGALSPDVHVIPAPAGAAGSQGGLWVKLAAGYRHALAVASFDLLLRLDADALVIGPGLEDLARARFASDPGLGMLGSYRYDMTGAERDWSPAARALGTACGLRGLRRPGLRRLLRRLRREAVANGYVVGEHPLGGAYLHSAAAVQAMARRGWLDLPGLAASTLGEDHLFALLTVGAGFRIGDFGGPEDPMALRWRGLPAPPADLLARHKLVTHSVRYWNDLDETSIRSAFAAVRAREETGAGPPP